MPETNLWIQTESVKTQYYKLATRDIAIVHHVNMGDFEVLKLFLSNSKIFTTYHVGEDKYYDVLNLNIALINHSCIPNARSAPAFVKQDGEIDLSIELRATKGICKGEEITSCYFNDLKKYGSIPRKRKIALRNTMDLMVNAPFVWAKFKIRRRPLKS